MNIPGSVLIVVLGEKVTVDGARNDLLLLGVSKIEEEGCSLQRKACGLGMRGAFGRKLKSFCISRTRKGGLFWSVEGIPVG